MKRGKEGKCGDRKRGLKAKERLGKGGRKEGGKEKRGREDVPCAQSLERQRENEGDFALLYGDPCA